MNQASQIIPATPETIELAAAALRRGELVAFPTETVYGLGGDARNDGAVARIFEVKGRPTFNPLIIHVANLAAAREIAEFSTLATHLAAHFWPGPLTLVLPRKARCGISYLASAGLETLALRVPNQPTARQLLKAAAMPLAAPSANRSGHVSPTTANHVKADFPIDGPRYILDGGPTLLGLESTIVQLTPEAGNDGEMVILRAGALPLEQLEEFAGRSIHLAAQPGDQKTGDQNMQPNAPGQLISHYAPGLPVRMQARAVNAGEALLAFGPTPPTGAAITLNLSATGNLGEAAANLFAMLRALDQPAYTGIAVMPVPEIGLGRAINDRLRRASATRLHGTQSLL